MLDHTEGPWYVDLDRRREGSDQVVDPEGKTICFMATGLDPEEAYANVLLVSRAPELLRLLRQILEDPGRIDRPSWQSEARAIDRELREGPGGHHVP